MSGETVISIIQFRTKTLSDSLIRPSNTTQYAAGDCLSEVTTNDHLVFPYAAQSKALSGAIDSATIVSSANQGTLPDLELWLFHTDIGEVADNSAFAPSDAEMLTLVGILDFPVADWKIANPGSGAAGNAVCQLRNVGLPYRLDGPKDETNPLALYGQLVFRNTYTPVSAEQFTVILGTYQD